MQGLALPIALGLVDPASSGEPDQPGPWPVATCFILRAQHDAKLDDRSRRTLEWLNTI